MKINLVVYVSNNGDGSSGVHFFRSIPDANKYASLDGERFNDDIFSVTLELDEQGRLIRDSAELKQEEDAAWAEVSRCEKLLQQANKAQKDTSSLKQQLKEAKKRWRELMK